MTNTRRNIPQILLVSLLFLSVIGYNLWSYSCGYCTLASLLRLSTPAILLITCNLLAGVMLLVIRRRNRQQELRSHCACGEILRSSWQFCPNCGHSRQK